ncbi:MAG: pyridoxal-phosphate dependent enzyme [bacterium]|nr:pyridoxal-phosphate dependent enzyme [bacterium]
MSDPVIDESRDARLGLGTSVVDEAVLARAARRFGEQGIVLPTFAQLAEPRRTPASALASLAAVGRNEADPRNLWRVHWYNDTASGGLREVPSYVVLPPEFTGVASPILVAFGDTFPMIGAHKVLAAYACLVPRLVTGAFDPTAQRAVWPSTGNYARGGVAISRIMRCRGVAVLPENMSRERFEWLERWVADPGDIVATPGSESNVKEIYDACAELAATERNVIFNQFSEFSNHAGHYAVTGPALAHAFADHAEARPGLRLAAFVAASGSSGTLGAGDYLKERHGTRIVAVEALECPTMLYNGFGEHNIQGIGDKHIPLVHNVMNSDAAVAVSDAATDGLFMAFGHEGGRRVLSGRGTPAGVLASLDHFGLSSICNVLAAIKYARTAGLGADDVIVTVATDGAALYESERPRLVGARFGGSFDDAAAAAQLEAHLIGADTSHVLLLDEVGRSRIFNLGYFTWVEQQGVSLEDFEARRQAAFWDRLHAMVPAWDAMIDEFNARSGAATGG